MTISQEIREKLLVFQKNEITEHHIYMRLAGTVKASENRHILERIAQDKPRPYREWRAHTQQDVKPDQLKMTLRSEKGRQGLWSEGVSTLPSPESPHGLLAHSTPPCSCGPSRTAYSTSGGTSSARAAATGVAELVRHLDFLLLPPPTTEPESEQQTVGQVGNGPTPPHARHAQAQPAGEAKGHRNLQTP